MSVRPYKREQRRCPVCGLSLIHIYLRRQGRFKALTDEDIAQVEATRDAKWEVMRRDWA